MFLGPKLIIGEYAVGVFFSVALGLFVLFRGHSFWQTALGLYLISVGMNYVPMLIYAVVIASRQRAHAEIAAELTERRQALSKYRRQSLLLLVPLLAPVLAITQERRRSHELRLRSN